MSPAMQRRLIRVLTAPAVQPHVAALCGKVAVGLGGGGVQRATDASALVTTALEAVVSELERALAEEAA